MYGSSSTLPAVTCTVMPAWTNLIVMFMTWLQVRKTTHAVLLSLVQDHFISHGTTDTPYCRVQLYLSKSLDCDWEKMVKYVDADLNGTEWQSTKQPGCGRVQQPMV